MATIVHDFVQAHSIQVQLGVLISAFVLLVLLYIHHLVRIAEETGHMSAVQAYLTRHWSVTFVLLYSVAILALFANYTPQNRQVSHDQVPTRTTAVSIVHPIPISLSWR